MKKYIVNYNTGAGNQEAETLEEAKQLAIEGMAYTQQDITIEYNGEIVTTARWYGVEPVELSHYGDHVLLEIGDGFYELWSDELENL